MPPSRAAATLLQNGSGLPSKALISDVTAPSAGSIRTTPPGLTQARIFPSGRISSPSGRPSRRASTCTSPLRESTRSSRPSSTPTTSRPSASTTTSSGPLPGSGIRRVSGRAAGMGADDRRVSMRMACIAPGSTALQEIEYLLRAGACILQRFGMQARPGLLQRLVQTGFDMRIVLRIDDGALTHPVAGVGRLRIEVLAGRAFQAIDHMVQVQLHRAQVRGVQRHVGVDAGHAYLIGD